MTYAQSPQPAGKPNRLALWINSRKTAANQPDYKGNVEITWDLLQEMLAAFNAGQYQQDNAGRPCLKLDVAIYAQQPDANKPIMSGRLSTVAETAESAAARAQYKAQMQGQQGYAQQHAPQSGQPQPQADAQGNWVPSFAAPQAPAGPAPAAPAPMPAYQQPPAPVQAPPAVPQPMPGALHAPPAPAAPAAQLPPGF
jgi:hypothetical protein